MDTTTGVVVGGNEKVEKLEEEGGTRRRPRSRSPGGRAPSYDYYSTENTNNKGGEYEGEDDAHEGHRKHGRYRRDYDEDSLAYSSERRRDHHRRRSHRRYDERDDDDDTVHRRRRHHSSRYDRYNEDNRYGDRHYRGRYNNNNKAKHIKDISVEDELAQLDKTMRTVQVFNLNLKASERDLFQFFVQAGPLADIKIIKDRHSGRSKGFAYVEFEKKEGVAGALALSGKELMGQTVMVKPSEAEKNVAWHTEQAAKKLAKEGSEGHAGKVNVANIHPSLTEEFLKPIFEPFGPVFSVHLNRDERGVSLGTAVVQFVNHADAVEAVRELVDKIDIQGMVMRLDLASSSVSSHAVAGNGIEERIDVDADDGGGMKLSAQSRVELMNKLAANAGIEVPKMPQSFIIPNTKDDTKDDDVALMQGVLGPASPIPTTCVLLKNAFDPSQETDPSWDEEIANDIREECSKFGQVLFVHVDKDSRGFVYIKFGNVQAAVAAQKSLHGRWYNLKQLCVDFQFVPLFDKHFHL